MRHFQNSLLDFKLSLTEGYASQPIETAWASEAMFFIRLEEVSGDAFRFEARPQISVNGIDWIDEGTAFPALGGPGQFVLRLTHFGGWLRLVGTMSGQGASAVMTANLVLKE